MTADSFWEAIEELRLAALQTGEGSVQSLDAALAKVTAHEDPQSIGPLLLMLNDATDYDEGMFSLVHAAEAFADDVYASAFLGVLADLCAMAPKWASVTLMRILNNEGAKRELIRALRLASPAERQAAKWLCNKVNERDPRFISKTLPVLIATEQPGSSSGGGAGS